MPFIPLHDTTPRLYIRRPWVNWLLIVGCVLAYLVQASGSEEGFLQIVYGLGVIPAVLTGEAELAPHLVVADPLFTLLSYQFLHGGFMHLAGNMLYLWVFGDNVEDSMGHVRFLLFYLICGIAAALAQVAFDPANVTPLIGASGSISGVLGAYLILHPQARVLVPIGFIPLYLPAWLLLIFWFGFQFLAAFGAPAADNVGWWAHIGGFIAGLVLVFVFRRRTVPLYGRHDPPGGVVIRRGIAWEPKGRRPPGQRGPWG